MPLILFQGLLNSNNESRDQPFSISGWTNSVFHHNVWCYLQAFCRCSLSNWGSSICSSSLLSAFVIHGYWILPSVFSVRFHMIMWFFFFNLLLLITLIDLQCWAILESWNKHAWLLCIIFLVCSWSLLVIIMLKILPLYSWRVVVYSFFSSFLPSFPFLSIFSFSGFGSIIKYTWDFQYWTLRALYIFLI